MKPETHLRISPALVGEPVELAQGKAVARLQTRPEMCVDDQGLVHGGFAFGLADYAAMLAVNDPFVVLGAAETRFLAPVRVGETMTAQAEVFEEKGRKRVVRCSVATDRPVFEGQFTCFVLEKHVLDS
ncbi:MAG: PaaI family thioesterase [Desulfuromonadales bacterium]